MAKVRVWNPYRGENPRRKKALSSEQVERRQARAVRFLRDVTDDPDLADEIEHLSVAEYAERKGFPLSNPLKKKEISPVKQQEVVRKLKEELRQEMKDVAAVEVAKRARSNPSVAVHPVRKKAVSLCVFGDDETARGG
jgi:hypothetical protein